MTENEPNPIHPNEPLPLETLVEYLAYARGPPPASTDPSSRWEVVMPAYFVHHPLQEHLDTALDLLAEYTDNPSDPSWRASGMGDCPPPLAEALLERHPRAVSLLAKHVPVVSPRQYNPASGKCEYVRLCLHELRGTGISAVKDLGADANSWYAGLDRAVCAGTSRMRSADIPMRDGGCMPDLELVNVLGVELDTATLPCRTPVTVMVRNDWVRRLARAAYDLGGRLADATWVKHLPNASSFVLQQGAMHAINHAAVEYGRLGL